MKIAVTGHQGKIGSELVDRGYVPLMADDGDITNLEEVRDDISRVDPDVIVHCAALTDVGYCEEHRDEAFRVNVRGVNNILYDFNKTLIYLSSVHVFNGKKYWEYSEKHKPDPVSVYGLTKWAGEEIAKFNTGRTIVVRISRTFDYDSLKPNLDILESGEELEITTLIKRSFQYMPHFVDNLTWLINNMDEFPDVETLNIAGKDTLSYYDFWLQVCNIFGYSERLEQLKPRTWRIEDHPRPFRGGLRVNLAEKMGMKIYSAIDGLKVI
jgi:dTDP-4-dehydrorhamnose reductase